MNKEIIKKIMSKKEFSDIPESLVERVIQKVYNKEMDEREVVKKTRALLRKNLAAFLSRNLLKKKLLETEKILRSHTSTRERYPYYDMIYKEILRVVEEKEPSIIDLGAGINGLSYDYFLINGYKPRYIAIEAVGQLVDLMNQYFETHDINGRAIKMDLFNLEELLEVVRNTDKPRIVFLFKLIDGLEIIERDYSKRLLLALKPLTDLMVISIPTRSLSSRRKFRATREWLKKFLRENFEIVKNFSIPGEEFIIIH